MVAGDFWHARGSLPVEPLNAVLRELRHWSRPTLMLVGNHDQVTIPMTHEPHIKDGEPKPSTPHPGWQL